MQHERKRRCPGPLVCGLERQNGTSWAPHEAASTMAVATKDATGEPVHLRAAATTPMVPSSVVRMPDRLLAAVLGVCLRR